MLAAGALTTLVTMLDELALTGDGGAQDARLERFINAATALVESHCARRFARVDEIEESLRPRGTVYLWPERAPILTVHSITVDGAELAATDYEIHDVRPGTPGKLFRASSWPSSAARLTGITYPPLPGTESANVVVNYDGGYVTPHQVALEEAKDPGDQVAAYLTRTLPHDLEDAVVMLVTSRWKSRGTDRRITSEAYENATLTFGGVPLPKEVLSILSHYGRIASA